MTISPIETIIEDIRQGKMVIMMDDEDRENEGDIVMAAQKVTASAINFMMQHARGLVCMPLTQAQCDKLALPLMVAHNQCHYGTNFTVSIEAARGVTTGVSAQDKTNTILAAASPDATPNDIVKPGHIFPLLARPGGVLERQGHTEASTDLVKLAGLNPVAIVCEVINDDGTMARRPALEVFAKKHGLTLGTVASLIEYRKQLSEKAEKGALCGTI